MAIACPMPELPPVTIAVLPSRPFIVPPRATRCHDCCPATNRRVTRNARIGRAHCGDMHLRSGARAKVSGASALAAARDARLEAQRVVGDDFEARVLEPSPPAIVDGDWFADDPAAVDAPPGRPIVGPVGGGDLTWDAWLGDHPEHVSWA